MDLVCFDDLKVSRGVQMLEGTAASIVEDRNLVAAEGSEGKGGENVGPNDGTTARKDGGLEIGRRVLVVVKHEGEEPESASTPRGGSTNVFRVVDHGTSQKEAVRRLFDAQVLLRSLDEQLQEKEKEVQRLQKLLKASEVEEDAAAAVDAPRRIPAHILAEMKTTEKSGQGPSKRKIPLWLRNDEGSRKIVDEHRENLLKMYMQDGHLDGAGVVEHFWQCGLDFCLRWAPSPDDAIQKQCEAIELRARKIQREALQETSMLRQHIKKLEKKYKELQQAAKQVKSGGGQQSMPLGFPMFAPIIPGQTGGQMHSAPIVPPAGFDGSARKSLEVIQAAAQSSEAAASAARVAAASASAAAENIKRCSGTGAAGNLGMGNSMVPMCANCASNYAAVWTPSHQSSPAVNPGMPGGHLGMLGAHPGMPADPQGGLGMGTGAQMPSGGGQNSGGYGTGGVPGIGGPPGADGRGGTTGGQGGSSAAQATIQKHTSEALESEPKFEFGSGKKLVPLIEDNTLDYSIDPDDMEQFDNELFEPIKKFDDDMQELLIDCVNEKVRRILSLDPSKFQNGKLPFGLRPDASNASYEAEVKALSEEIFKLKDQLRATNQVKEAVAHELSLLRSGVGHGGHGQGGGFVGGFGGGDPSDPNSPGAKGKKKKRMGPNGVEEDDDEIDPDVLKAAVDKALVQYLNRIRALEKQLRDLGVEPVATDMPDQPGQLGRSGPAGEQGGDRISELERINTALEEHIATLEQQLRDAGIEPAKRPRGATSDAGQHKSGRRKKKPGDGKDDGGDDDSDGSVCPHCGRGPSRPGKHKSKDGDIGQGTIQRTGGVLTGLTDADIDNMTEEQLAELLKVLGGSCADLMSLPPEERAIAAIKLFIKQAQAVARMQATLHKLLHKNSTVFDVRSRFQRVVEALVGKFGGPLREEPDILREAVQPYMGWTEDVVAAMPALIRGGGGRSQGLAGTGGTDAGDGEHIDEDLLGDDDGEGGSPMQRLQRKCKRQQDEISRLLVTIDELRSRMERIMEAAGEHGGDLANMVGGIMSKVGLKDIMEGGSGPKLKGVFERLYQDAIQRIQRLGLIRERMVLANQAYSEVVSAVAGQKGVEEVSCHGSRRRSCCMESLASASPDLVRLKATASAALQGMWYHTEYLFNRACEYAVAQGIEASVLKSHVTTLEDLMDGAEDPEGSRPGTGELQTPSKLQLRRRGSDRLPGRRGDRPRHYPGASGDGKAFWHPLPGGLSSAMTPRSMRKLNVQDPTSNSFTSYVASLREARGDLRPDEWTHCARQQPEKKGARGDEKLNTLLGMGGKSGSRGFANSQSLPVLPKGRSIMAVDVGDSRLM